MSGPSPQYGELVEFLCKCSFLEIYNEQVFDLLDSASSGLHLRENMKHGVYVDGLTESSVQSAKEAYQVLSTGWVNRKVASTSMNRESSRSHAVFTLSVESKKRVRGREGQEARGEGGRGGEKREGRGGEKRGGRGGEKREGREGGSELKWLDERRAGNVLSSLCQWSRN